MKRIVLIFVIIFCVSKNTKAQTATGNFYEDAQKFLKCTQGASSKEEFLSLANYYFASKDTKSLSVMSAIKANPFFSAYDFDALLNDNKNAPGVPPQGGGGSLMGMNVSNFADGLAKFLIERGKQELSMVFFDRFRKDLKKYPEIAYLFPRSTHIINNIELHNVNTLLQELRDAFTKDLLNEPNNILSLRDISKNDCDPKDKDYPACVKRTEIIQSVFSPTNTTLDPRTFVIPLTVMQGVMNGNNIIKIMGKVCSDPLVCKTNDDLNSYIKLTSLFMESLRTNGDRDGLFINEVQLKNLFSNEDLLRIFLGLVYQKYSSDDCYKDIKLSGANLQSVFESVLSKRNDFYSGMTSLDNINMAYVSLRKQIQNGQKPDNSAYASLISSSLGSINNFLNSFSNVTGAKIPDECKLLVNNLKTGVDLCIDIQQKNYAGIFNGAIILINETHIIKDEALSKTTKYLSFAANIASASTSEEMKEAINSVALPPGSYSIKQNSNFNISANAYIGYAYDLNFGTKKDPVFANGVYAPVGVSFNWGLGKNKKGGAFSIFISFIDVGAIASFRLSNGMTDSLKQEVRFESIISPSTQLIYEIPRTPISLCAGWRFTPKLFFKSGQTFATVAPHDVLNLSFLIDIPVVTLKNSPRK